MEAQLVYRPRVSAYADADFSRSGEEEDEEDQFVDDTGYKTVKDAVLFCIDISESMLKRPPPSDDKKADRDSPASAALKCAYQLMQQRIISHPHDMMGVMLFGTEKSKMSGQEVDSRQSTHYKHCYVLTDMDVPEAADVKSLRNIVEDEEEFENLIQPSKEEVSMAKMLFAANYIFTTKAPNFSSRRVFLVTDNDDPHSNDKAQRDPATHRAKDLYDLGVSIELFAISKPGHAFDRTKFYDDIVYRATPGDENAPAPLISAPKPSESGGGISLLQSLLANINSKAAPRRAFFTVPLEIGPGLTIGVKGYMVIKRQEPTRSCYVWTDGEKAQLVHGSTTMLAEDTARTVEKVEIKKAFKFGGDSILFTDEELKKIKNFGDPIMRIIGFKDLKLLPIWATTKHPSFIYPSEQDFVGSTRVFSALQQNMLKKKKFALVWFQPRRNAFPILAAAVASAERRGDDGEQVTPPGIWIRPLPFADDVRQNPDTDLVRAPNTLIDLMRVVIEQLMLPKAMYDPQKYSNPALQWHYRILQALALDEDIPETPEDKTLPRYRQIDKRAGKYVIKWGETLEEEYQTWILEHGHRSKPAAATKKRSADPSSAPAPKKAKVATATDELTIEEMREKFEKNSIDKLTVAVLKQWCGSQSLPTTGKKADLVERIQEYFENK
ncbi:hypothetical protein EG327_002550 [Venturia inaequalis]|uniref:ATP-dependent DNA helicase II subunit 1 n=1 Tax=Venturia inaequalis TaxID=5025 RepID=A0A8H3ZJ98_VENIN|nr:hypothetical protein EG327_002550 [Venturia inaequalis]